MSATTNANGRLRKSLAEQIDRLDSILDGLSENLNEAVATAVKEAVALAVHEAVRGVLLEVLTNPALLEKLRGTLTPPAPVAIPVPVPPSPQASESKGITHFLSQAGRWCHGLWTRARAAWGSACEYLGQYGQVVRRCWRHLLIALGVGVVVALVVWLTGPWLGPLAGWVAGFVMALGVQTVMALRRLLPSLVKVL